MPEGSGVVLRGGYFSERCYADGRTVGVAVVYCWISTLCVEHRGPATETKNNVINEGQTIEPLVVYSQFIKDMIEI